MVYPIKFNFLEIKEEVMVYQIKFNFFSRSEAKVIPGW